MDDIKVLKEKNNQLRSKLDVSEKNSQLHIQHTIKLKDQIKEIKLQMKKYRIEKAQKNFFGSLSPTRIQINEADLDSKTNYINFQTEAARSPYLSNHHARTHDGKMGMTFGPGKDPKSGSAGYPPGHPVYPEYKKHPGSQGQHPGVNGSVHESMGSGMSNCSECQRNKELGIHDHS